MDVKDRIKEDGKWGTILKRCRVYRHPNKLCSRDRAIQKLLLDALSSDPNNLPEGRTRWESWLEWHFDQT